MKKLIEQTRKRIFTQSPKWFRKLRRIIYTLTGGSLLTGTLQKFGFTPDQIIDLIGWVMMILEVMNILLVENDTAEIKPN